MKNKTPLQLREEAISQSESLMRTPWPWVAILLAAFALAVLAVRG